MTPKMIFGDKFIAAMIEADLLPLRTVSVTISAIVGETILMEYEVYGDERLLGIAANGIEETDDEAKAIAK